MTEWLPASTQHLENGSATIVVQKGESPIPEPGTTYLVRIRRPRNPKHHRLYWGMVRHIVEATDRWPTETALHRWIKYELGLYTIQAVDHGKFIVEWDSTDFMSMDQARFSDYFDRAVIAICLECGIYPLDFEREIET